MGRGESTAHAVGYVLAPLRGCACNEPRFETKPDLTVALMRRDSQTCTFFVGLVISLEVGVRPFIGEQR